MSALSLALGTQAAARLSVDIGKPNGVRTWLLEGGYYIDSSSSNDSVVLLTNDIRDYLSYVSFDYSRFALSSWESFSVCQYEREASSLLGWPLIKLYYAAFFSAHALMRAEGGGIIRLEKNQAARLCEFGKLVIGEAFSVQPGNFQINTSQNVDGTLNVRLDRIVESGGAHDGFWKKFLEYLVFVESDAVSRKSPDASQIVADVTAISRLLKGPGGDNGTWLSVVRNKINYQHEYGVWFPAKGGHAAYAALDMAKPLSTANVRLDFNPSKEALSAFVGASHFLSSLNFDVAERLAARSTSALGFGSKWRRLKVAVAKSGVSLAA